MKTKSSIRKAAETAAGTAIGAAIAGPLGAVAGGLAASHIESGIDSDLRQARRNSPTRRKHSKPVFQAAAKRVLIPVDFSEPSVYAMRFARKWAGKPKTEIRLMHVVDPNWSVGEFGVLPMGQVSKDLIRRARSALDVMHQKEFNSSARVSLCVRKGVAYDQIVAEARRFGAEIIVIAKHGRSPLSQAFLGSTAERVVQHAHCPVLVLPRAQ